MVRTGLMQSEKGRKTAMNSDRFEYTYSPQKNYEAERIASKYREEKPDEELKELYRLDKRAEFPGTVTGIAIGIIGTVILALSINYMVSSAHFYAGLVLSAAGLAVTAAAAPVSLLITRKNRIKHKDRILQLSERINSRRK